MKKFINYDDGSEFNNGDVVFRNDELIIVKNDDNTYTWYTEPEKRHDLILWCRATYKIRQFKLSDKGYPLSEIISEEEMIGNCQSQEDIKNLKGKLIWHDAIWETSQAYTSSGRSHPEYRLIEIVNDKPIRLPKFLLSDGYYRHGEHFHFEKDIE